MKRNPLITITTACYNSEKTIKNTIESVLNQTYRNFEYWIIDGGSEDNTLSIIEEYMKKTDKIHLISEPDNGMYDAINKGIVASSGEIIGNLNSDDTYVSKCFQYVVDKYREENYPFIIINGYMQRVDDKKKVIHTYEYDDSYILKKKCFGHPTMFAARKVFDVVGLYDDTYRLCADGDWQYRAYENKNVKNVIVKRVFTKMRAGGATDQFDKRWIWFKEVVRMKKEHRIAPIFIIYFTGLLSVVKTDIKNLIPQRLQSDAYRMVYYMRDLVRRKSCNGD